MKAIHDIKYMPRRMVKNLGIKDARSRPAETPLFATTMPNCATMNERLPKAEAALERGELLKCSWRAPKRRNGSHNKVPAFSGKMVAAHDVQMMPIKATMIVPIGTITNWARIWSLGFRAYLV